VNRRDNRAIARVIGAAASNASLAAVLGVVTARTLGPAGQGVITAITTVVALVVVAATLGTGASLRLRSVPSPSREDVRAFGGLSVVLAVVGGALSCVLVAVTQQAIVNAPLMLATFLLGAASLAARQVSELVQAYDRVATSILSVGVGLAVQIAFFATLSLAGRASVELAIASGIAGAIAQAIFGFARIWSYRPPTALLLAPRIWGELVSHGSRTVGYGLGLLTMQRVDRLILVAVSGPVAGGLYAVAATLAEVARLSSTAIGQLLFVRTAAARAVDASTMRMYHIGVGIQAATLTVIGVTAPVLVPLVFGPEYEPAIPLLRGLVAAEFLLGLALMDSRMALGLGRFMEVSVITTVCVGLAVPAYILLVTRWDAGGAVAGSIVVYAAYSGLLLMRRRAHGSQPPE